MEPIKIDQILKVTGGRLVAGGAEKVFSSVLTDSRAAVADGSALFVPIKGEKFDGHDYIPGLVGRAGWDGSLCENGKVDPATVKGKNFALIEVGSALQALGQIAAHNRGLYNIPVLAVTGSVGKTTTKEIMGAIARQKFETVVSEASFNNHVGVPLTLLRIGKSTRAAVIEMGMNHPGEIGSHVRLTRPKIGVITNVGPCHLEQLKTLENIARAKAEIVEGMDVSGTLVLNRDDEYSMKVCYKLGREKVGRILTFGLSEKADFKAVNIKENGDGIAFEIDSLLLKVPIPAFLPLSGTHNIYNALAAFTAFWSIGMESELIVAGMAQVKSAKMRWEEIELDGRALIMDCYNANPMSVEAALATLGKKYKKPRKVFVFGNMGELGADSAQWHRRAADHIKAGGVGKVVLLGELAGLAAERLLELGFDPDSVVKCLNNREAAQALKEVSAAGDVVLIKGSRRNRMEEIVQYYKESLASQRS